MATRVNILLPSAEWRGGGGGGGFWEEQIDCKCCVTVCIVAICYTGHQNTYKLLLLHGTPKHMPRIIFCHTEQINLSLIGKK